MTLKFNNFLFGFDYCMTYKLIFKQEILLIFYLLKIKTLFKGVPCGG